MLKTNIRFLLLATLLTFISLVAAAIRDQSVRAENPITAAEKPEKTPKPKTKAAVKTAPDALVKDLYKQHDAGKGPFFQDKNRALVDKYFIKSTADLIWKDAVESQGEVGALGADPLYDAQDTDIKNFKVGAAEIKTEKASVTVTFDNFGEKHTIKFMLAQEKGEWKIEDIDYGEYTFLSFYQDDAES